MKVAKMMAKHRLFAAPLGNGDWMVGNANAIYHLDILTDHYKDKRLTIAPTLEEAIRKRINRTKSKGER